MARRPGPGPLHGGDAGATLTRLLLDTTFLIDAERSGDSLDDWIEDDDEPAIAAITVAELRVGVLLAKGKTRTNRQAFLEDVVRVVPIVDYDVGVAEAHAELLVHVRGTGTPRGAHDLVIAATARASGRMVVTADRPAFADLPGVTVRVPRP